jgi:hypothetical protein
MVGLSSKIAGPLAGITVALMAMACNPRGLQPATRTLTPTSTLAFRSAVVVPEATAATLSCHGDAFCREDALAPGNASAVEDLSDDCVHRGGTTSTRACPRLGVVATCTVTSGELGPIKVYTYAQPDHDRERDAVATMTELCEQFDGTLEAAKR